MKVELKPGEKVTVTFAESDGSIDVIFAEDRIAVETAWPDTAGREGIIYEEKFGHGIEPPEDDGIVDLPVLSPRSRDERLAAIRSRWAAAAEGPWEFEITETQLVVRGAARRSIAAKSPAGGGPGAGEQYKDDFKFLAASHSDVAWLLGLVEGMEEQAP